MLTHPKGWAALVGLVAALFSSAGCSKRTQLRVVAMEPTFRAGRLDVTASTSLDSQNPPLTFEFADPNRTSASFLFKFHPQSSWRFFTVVTTQFTPTTPAVDECMFACDQFLSLVPGRSYLVKTPIIVLPRACPVVSGPDNFAAATDVCAEANNLIQLPNCRFIVVVNTDTQVHRCDLMCFGEPPLDPNPDGTSDVTQGQDVPGRGVPNMSPTPADDRASFDAGTLDASDAAVDTTPPPADVAPVPVFCGAGPDACDGRAFNPYCPAGTTCSAGRCLSSCVETTCFPGQTCRSDGLCVDTACLSATCSASQVCVAGSCVDPCSG